MESDNERIISILAETSRRYQGQGGDITLDGIEGGIIRVAPAGFCWR